MKNKIVISIGSLLACIASIAVLIAAVGPPPILRNSMTTNQYVWEKSGSSMTWTGNVAVSGTVSAGTTGTASTNLVAYSQIGSTVMRLRNGIPTPYAASANTDTARGQALTNAFVASQAGDTIIIGNGNFYLDSSSVLTVSSNQTIILQGARLYHDAASENTNIFLASNVSNWRITGNGQLSGAGAGGESGIVLSGECGNWSINGITFDHWGSNGIYCISFGISSTKSGGVITTCNFRTNTYGLFIDSGGEYNVISDCVFSKNTTGTYCAGGNNNYVRCDITENTYGLVLTNSNNNAHGVVSACAINHNTYNLIADGISNGETLSGNHFYVGEMYFTGVIQGLQLIGGQIDSTSSITTSNLSGGYTYFRDMWFNGGPPTVTGDSTTNALRFVNCTDATLNYSILNNNEFYGDITHLQGVLHQNRLSGNANINNTIALGGAVKLYWGVNGTSGGIITGNAVGDVAYVTPTTGSINFSTDTGNTTLLKLEANNGGVDFSAVANMTNSVALPTNSAPSNITWGVTPPDLWAKVKVLSTGWEYYGPVWTNH